MAKDWPYAEIAKRAKACGGPEMYAETLERYGFQKGILIMLPVCVGCCVFTYKKGKQVVHFFKDKLNIVTKEEAKEAQQRLTEIEQTLYVECSNCGRKAYGIDEIQTVFGFTKNEEGNLVPQTCCKQCRNA